MEVSKWCATDVYKMATWHVIPASTIERSARDNSGAICEYVDPDNTAGHRRSKAKNDLWVEQYVVRKQAQEWVEEANVKQAMKIHKNQKHQRLS